jgi:tetratricopeptide (TPR) repeat protein
MGDAKKSESVRCWEEDVIIPTYPVQDADPNPMFLEKRVYQGSSGKVYPNPFTDKVALEKRDQVYRAVMLENEYIHLMILPEIGGRIHAGRDKTNGYDFFYRQNVIKPALVGLLGPWISGGVEFNWPQHHRPSTYMPVHAVTEKGADGSWTVWLSEHDPMSRMKGMVGICLSPGKAIVEAKVRLYNRTPLSQTFLWWANVAVRVHEQYQAFFPPDVTFVADHAKRAITSFPIACSSYYGVDYSPGTDISWYKNIPVPTSYMVTESKYDFFGGYDYGRQAGMVHTSNHHIAPGKKLWTWGNAEFGYAWDRNLTDEGGAYVELMAGAYTDNQPDFSWLQPFETKRFSQYWYPIQKIGAAKNANREAAVNLEFEGGMARVGVAVTSSRKVRVILTRNGRLILDEVHSLAPDRPYLKELPAEEPLPERFILIVKDPDENEIIAYQPERRVERELPEPASEPKQPADIASLEELYLTGLHLEQYRHATRSPEEYWKEGLEREPENARLNNAMGLSHLRRGEFALAEDHFERAVHRLTSRNPNPYDGEPFYNLGLARLYQGKSAEAYEAFYKSVWNYAWQSAGYYALASICAARGDLAQALELVEQSLLTNTPNLKARSLRAALLRKLDRHAEAQKVIDETLALDPLDFRTMAELYLLDGSEQALQAFERALQGDVQTLLDVSFDIAWSGFHQDALTLLKACADRGKCNYPMVWYAMSWHADALHQKALAATFLANAEKCPTKYCFPARLEELIILESALQRNPTAAKAHYYLGNLYYDKRRYQDAIRSWRRSVDLDDSFSIPLRNLGIAEFNVNHDPAAANSMYQRAFKANPWDARLLYEWDQLKKRAGLATPAQRLEFLIQHPSLVEERDDLSVEFITLLNQAGRYEDALERISRRRFSPWEGGEGLVSAQYVHAHRALGLAALFEDRFHDALSHFESARHYPANLGEGKHRLTLERDLDYFSGLAAKGLGYTSQAEKYWSAAASPLPSPGVHSYFRACALNAMGEAQTGREVLQELSQFAASERTKTPKIDYFATSLPNLLLFEDDLGKRNRIEASVLSALSGDGLGEREKAVLMLQDVIEEDPNHLFAMEMLRWMRWQTSTMQEKPEVRSVS